MKEKPKFLVVYRDNSSKTVWGFFDSVLEADRFIRSVSRLLDYPHQFFDVIPAEKKKEIL